MRESRCMSLLPRTTLHSDSEQYMILAVRDRVLSHCKDAKNDKIVLSTWSNWKYHELCNGITFCLQDRYCMKIPQIVRNLRLQQQKVGSVMLAMKWGGFPVSAPLHLPTSATAELRFRWAKWGCDTLTNPGQRSTSELSMGVTWHKMEKENQLRANVCRTEEEKQDKLLTYSRLVLSNYVG